MKNHTENNMKELDYDDLNRIRELSGTLKESWQEKMKERPMPFDAQILDAEPEMIQNPFSGASIELDPQEIAVYDVIMGSTMTAEKMSAQGEHKQAERLYKDVRKGIDWFIKHNPKAYMVLLD